MTDRVAAFNLVLGRTQTQIQQEIREVLTDICSDSEIRQSYYEKLAENYVVVQELFQMRNGRYVRWIDEAGELWNGGVVVGTKFQETGATVILLCGWNRRMYQYRYDTSTTFMKMTRLEKLYIGLEWEEEPPEPAPKKSTCLNSQVARGRPPPTSYPTVQTR